MIGAADHHGRRDHLLIPGAVGVAVVGHGEEDKGSVGGIPGRRIGLLERDNNETVVVLVVDDLWVEGKGAWERRRQCAEEAGQALRILLDAGLGVPFDGDVDDVDHMVWACCCDGVGRDEEKPGVRAVGVEIRRLDGGAQWRGEHPEDVRIIRVNRKALLVFRPLRRGSSRWAQGRALFCPQQLPGVRLHASQDV